MLDPKYFRGDISEIAKRLATRNYTLDVNRITELEAQRIKTKRRTAYAGMDA